MGDNPRAGLQQSLQPFVHWRAVNATTLQPPTDSNASPLHRTYRIELRGWEVSYNWSPRRREQARVVYFYMYIGV